MTETATQWNVDKLGEWSKPKQTEVTAEATVAYAKATNADNPAYLDGTVAPPVYAIVPPFEQLGEPTMSIVPGEYLMRVVHGEQDMTFHRPIVPGMTLETTVAGLGIHKAPSGVTLHSQIKTTTADGEPVNDQWMVAFFRGAEDEIDVGEAAPSHRTDPSERSDEPVATVEQRFDDDQTYRYSEASGDLMPIHLDEDVAKAMGLPGIIIHGLCTMAFNANAIVAECCGGETERLKRLAVRFSRPNLPGQKMTTQIWSVDGAANGPGVYSFESANEAGDVVIKDGLAEVAG